jgi:hypothetical protein
MRSTPLDKRTAIAFAAAARSDAAARADRHAAEGDREVLMKAVV